MLNQLSQKEKWVLGTGSGLLLVFMAWQFLVQPTLEHRANLRRATAAKRKDLKDLERLSLEYQRLKTDIERIQEDIRQQPDKGRVLSSLEYIRDNWGLADHITTMRPTTCHVLGRLLASEFPEIDPERVIRLAINFALSTPEVDCVLVGMRRVEEVRRNVALAEDAGARIDLRALHERYV